MPLFCDQTMKLPADAKYAPKGACDGKIPGTNLQAYANDNHLNTMGSIYLWPYICDMFHGETGPV
jgi:hypothetical protein